MLEPFVGTRSVLLMDGDHHRQERTRLVRALHGEPMSAWRTAMEDAARAELATWPVGEPFAVLPRLRSIALEVILRTVFGTADDDRLRRALDTWLDQAGSLAVLNPGFRRSLGGWSPWDRFVRAREAFDVELDRVIASSDAAGPDVLSLLLQSEPPLDPAELRDALLTVVAAGHDTTATAMAWAIDLLLHHPEALERLDDDGWLDAVVKEVLRLRPVIETVGRILTRDTTIGRWHLPAGVAAAPSTLLAGRRSPDPDAFRPERFLDQPIDPTTWLPFGGGIRRCLGASFATLEIKTVLRVLLTEATLRPAHARMERPKRRAVTLVPARRHAGGPRPRLRVLSVRPRATSVRGRMFLKTLTLKGFKSFADDHRARARAGRHRRRRAQRIGQVQRRRRHRLGARRPGARARCAARRWTTSSSPAPPSARRWAGPRCSLTIDNSRRAPARSSSPRSRSPARCSAPATASTPSTACPCRLLDIQELLSDTGVGRQQHVIVSQGQIDAVLNARPEERRADHRGGRRRPQVPARKEKAERRLAATEGNLTAPPGPAARGPPPAPPARAPGRRRPPPRRPRRRARSACACSRRPRARHAPAPGSSRGGAARGRAGQPRSGAQGRRWPSSTPRCSPPRPS